MTILTKRGERLMETAPGDPQALVLACRALAHSGEPRRSLELLQLHSHARSAVGATSLALLFREIGAADPALLAECQVALAREQLRRRDFEAARHTLEPVPAGLHSSPVACRIRVLRAEALLHCGDANGAALEIEYATRHATGAGRVQVVTALADLNICRGDLASARLALRRLGPVARKFPRVEALRAVSLGLSYLFEDRPHRALAWIRRARLAQRLCKDPAVDPLVLVVEVGALIALDRIDLATAVARQKEVADIEGGLEAANLPDSLASIFQLGVLYRRGLFAEALLLQLAVSDFLERRSDRVFLAFTAHVLARCAMGCGLLARAEQLVRIASGLADDPGFAVLRPMCELDFALLCELRGERAMAREHVERALGGPVQSPLARLERWALSSAEGSPPRPGYESGDAYADLRAAERALERGKIDEAETAAGRAEAWYRRVGAAYEVARAQLARAEALARASRLQEARAVLDSCLAAADRNGYAMVAIAARLVEAFVADRTGDFPAYFAAIRAAIERATPELIDRSLLVAALRVGLGYAGASFGAQPWRDRVERLGLARSGRIVYQRDERLWLLADRELPEDGADLVVALDRGEVLSGSSALKLPPQRLNLLAALARASRSGLTLEDLYTSVWAGTQYHPLRHRNTIYVGLNRLRESLAGVLPSGEIVEVTDGLCRLTPGLRVAVLDEARRYFQIPGVTLGKTM